MFLKKSLDNLDKYHFRDGKKSLTKVDICNLFQQCIAYSYNGNEYLGICQSVSMEIGFSPKISIYSMQMVEVFREEEISNFDWIKVKSEKFLLDFIKA